MLRVFKRENAILLVLLIVGLLLRLAVSNWAMHDDIIVQAGWGNWIYENGMRGFYENEVWIYGWPNQPPVISFLYGWGFKLHEWLNTTMVGIGSFIALNRLGASYIPWYYQFLSWFSTDKFQNTPYAVGKLISLKLIPIFGDLVLGVLIFWLVKKWKNSKIALLATAIYLFSPFSWYESAIWGQHDQMSFVFVLLAFLALTTKHIWAAPGLWVFSLMIKSTGLIFGPLLIWLAWRDRKNFKRFLIGWAIPVVGYYLLVSAISPLNFLQFNINLIKQMFDKGDTATWVNTYNFWRLATPFQTDSGNLFLGIKYSFWGYVMFGLVNILAFWVGRKRDRECVLNSLFLVGFGGWLFMTTMHERYLFTAIGTGLLLAVMKIQTLKWWVLLSTIYWLNLFQAWWKPDSWEWLKKIIMWPDGKLIPNFLSILMIGLFLGWVNKIWKYERAN